MVSGIPQALSLKRLEDRAHAGYQGELTEYKRLQEDGTAYRNGPETLTAKDAHLNEDIVAGRYAVGSMLFGPDEVTFPEEVEAWVQQQGALIAGDMVAASLGQSEESVNGDESDGDGSQACRPETEAAGRLQE